MISVALIGCSKGKRSTPQAARTMYVGDLFTKAVAYAEATCDSWHVLSAKHRLLDPDTVIEPYDMVLGHKVTGPLIYPWANGVIARLAEVYADPISHGQQLRLVMLAGRQYRSPLHYLVEKEPWCHSVEVPMEHLAFGQQKAWLMQNTPTKGAA